MIVRKPFKFNDQFLDRPDSAGFYLVVTESLVPGFTDRWNRFHDTGIVEISDNGEYDMKSDWGMTYACSHFRDTARWRKIDILPISKENGWSKEFPNESGNYWIAKEGSQEPEGCYVMHSGSIMGHELSNDVCGVTMGLYNMPFIAKRDEWSGLMTRKIEDDFCKLFDQ